MSRQRLHEKTFCNWAMRGVLGFASCVEEDVAAVPGISSLAKSLFQSVKRLLHLLTGNSDH